MEQAEEARRQQLEQEGQVAGQGQHPVPAGSVGTQSNPVVPEARRSNSSAAFYDQNAGSSSQPALTSQQERLA
jgi:hypothetical protein